MTSSKFWDRIAERYAAKPVPNSDVYEAKLERTRALLTPESRVVEIGCGTGTTALSLAPYVQSLLATDFSSEMINIAVRKAATAGVTNVEFRSSPVEQFNCEGESIDVVMAHSLLHLLKDRKALMRSVYHWLKPGGYFVTSTACIQGWMLVLKPIWPLFAATNVLPAVAFFNEDTLIREHERAGFVIEQRWQPSKPNLFLIARKPL